MNKEEKRPRPVLEKNLQYYKFCLYGFFKNLKFFDPYLILFFLDSGLSFLEIGVLLSVREIVTNLVEIPSGMVADVVGRRRAMLFSFACYIISFLIFFLFPVYGMFVLAMVFFGFGEAFRSGTHKAMILEYLRIKGIPELRVHYYGHTRGWSQAGAAVSAVIAALLVFGSGSYRIVFISSVIPYTLDLILILTYPRELDGETGGAGWSLKGLTRRFTAVFRGFIRTLGDPGFRRAMLSSSVYDGFFESVKDYIQPVMQQAVLGLPVLLMLGEERRTALFIGMVYAGIYVFTSIASRNAGTVSDRFPRISGMLNVTYGMSVGVMAAAGLVILLGVPAAAVALLVVYFLIKNLRRPMALGFLSERIQNQLMATGLSAESQAKTLSVALLAPLMGFLADKLGIGFGLVVVAALALLLYPLVRTRE